MLATAQPDRTGWTDIASQFFDHWDSLRGNAAAPASEVFLDNPNVLLQPRVFIFEVTDPQATCFRLMATELVHIWGQDFTGRTVEQVFSPDVAVRYLANPHTCLSQPCGLWEQGLFGNLNDREVILEILYLPLANAPDRPPRLVGLLAAIDTSVRQAARRGIIAIQDRRWLDIGRGTPSAAPDIFAVA